MAYFRRRAVVAFVSETFVVNHRTVLGNQHLATGVGVHLQSKLHNRIDLIKATLVHSRVLGAAVVQPVGAGGVAVSGVPVSVDGYRQFPTRGQRSEDNLRASLLAFFGFLIAAQNGADAVHIVKRRKGIGRCEHGQHHPDARVLQFPHQVHALRRDAVVLGRRIIGVGDADHHQVVSGELLHERGIVGQGRIEIPRKVELLEIPVVPLQFLEERARLAVADGKAQFIGVFPGRDGQYAAVVLQQGDGLVVEALHQFRIGFAVERVAQESRQVAHGLRGGIVPIIRQECGAGLVVENAAAGIFQAFAGQHAFLHGFGNGLYGGGRIDGQQQYVATGFQGLHFNHAFAKTLIAGQFLQGDAHPFHFESVSNDKPPVAEFLTQQSCYHTRAEACRQSRTVVGRQIEMPHHHAFHTLGHEVLERRQMDAVDKPCRMPDKRQGFVRVGFGIAVTGKMLGRTHHALALHALQEQRRETCHRLRVFSERAGVDDGILGIVVHVRHRQEIPLDA